MIGRRFAGCRVVALASRPDQEGTQWTRRLIGRRFPIQSIMFALRAHELCGILEQRNVLRIAHVVFALRVDIGQAHLDDVELVASYAPIEDLLLACLGVEAPTRVVLDEWEGEWPCVFSDLQNTLGIS